MNTGSFTSSVPIQVPPLVVSQLPKIFKSRIFITVSCSPAHQILGVFKEALGAATRDECGPTDEGENINKENYFIFHLVPHLTGVM